LTEPTKPVRVGLWNYSRFPTYLADGMFWVGIYFERLGVDFDDWWMIFFVFGYIAMLYCGIGLSETELVLRKEGYLRYMDKVNRLMFWPNDNNRIEMTPYV